MGGLDGAVHSVGAVAGSSRPAGPSITLDASRPAPPPSQSSNSRLVQLAQALKSHSTSSSSSPSVSPVVSVKVNSTSRPSSRVDTSERRASASESHVPPEQVNPMSVRSSPAAPADARPVDSNSSTSASPGATSGLPKHWSSEVLLASKKSLLKRLSDLAASGGLRELAFASCVLPPMELTSESLPSTQTSPHRSTRKPPRPSLEHASQLPSTTLCRARVPVKTLDSYRPTTLP